jgi:hypothetical protein
MSSRVQPRICRGLRATRIRNLFNLLGSRHRSWLTCGPNVTMEFPGAVVVLPHDDVLALVSNDITSSKKSVSANFDGCIAVSLHVNRFQVIVGEAFREPVDWFAVRPQAHPMRIPSMERFVGELRQPVSEGVLPRDVHPESIRKLAADCAHECRPVEFTEASSSSRVSARLAPLVTESAAIEEDLENVATR